MPATMRDYQRWPRKGSKSRWPRRGTTTARGLGADHQQERQRALATFPDGEPCARCQQHGIYHPLSRSAVRRSADGKRLIAPLLDLDDFPGRAYGGLQVKRLSWRFCNRSAGARLGNQMRGITRQWRQSRMW